MGKSQSKARHIKKANKKLTQDEAQTLEKNTYCEFISFKNVIGVTGIAYWVHETIFYSSYP